MMDAALLSPERSEDLLIVARYGDLVSFRGADYRIKGRLQSKGRNGTWMIQEIIDGQMLGQVVWGVPSRELRLPRVARRGRKGV